MNNKLLTTAAFMSIALGAYSAPIYTVLNLNSSLLIQNESSKDGIESLGEKLLALNLPKDKRKGSKKEEVEEDDDEELSEDAEKELFEEDTDDDSDGSDDDDDDDETSGPNNTDDDSDADDDDDDDDDDADYTEEGDDDDEPSNGNGFGDIKSKLDKKNTTLPESKTEYHVHKNAPHRTDIKKLDPQGSVQEYITYLFGDEIILKHTLSFFPNGTYRIDANYSANYKTINPANVVSKTTQHGNVYVTEFTAYGGKIIYTFTLTAQGNNFWRIDYKWKMTDPNL